MLNNNHIGTEHLLLGLVHEGEGVAAEALQSMGISLEAVRREVELIIGQGRAAPTGHIPFTPRAKKVLELSLREARQLGQKYIGTEHILLGLVREAEGVAAQVLQRLGAELNGVRETVIQVLSGYSGSAEGVLAEVGGPPESTTASQPCCPVCGADLAESAAHATLSVPAAEWAVEGNEDREIVFVYCGRCGRTIGILGA